jgi:hypothetical protein
MAPKKAWKAFFLGLLGLKQRKLIVVDNLSHFSFEKYKTYNSFTI